MDTHSCLAAQELTTNTTSLGFCVCVIVFISSIACLCYVDTILPIYYIFLKKRYINFYYHSDDYRLFSIFSHSLSLSFSLSFSSAVSGELGARCSRFGRRHMYSTVGNLRANGIMRRAAAGAWSGWSPLVLASYLPAIEAQYFLVTDMNDMTVCLACQANAGPNVRACMSLLVLGLVGSVQLTKMNRKKCTLSFIF
jgi:hypothetical protein